MPQTGWTLAQWVTHDRSRRWRSRKAFAQAVGLGARTIDKIETGQLLDYSPRTRRVIEAALGWEPGSFARAMQGHAPAYVTDEHLTELLDLWPDLTDQARALLVRFAREIARIERQP